jgi:osmoprotectant transport system permease protein
VSFFTDYLASPGRQARLLEMAVEHAGLVAASLAVAVVLGLALGIIAHRVSWLAPAILNTTSTFLTIPSLALFALLIPLVGIGFTPAWIALVMYALLPIVRNTVSGLYSVDQAVVESAKGMGMGGATRLVKIELPNAWPVVLAGVRVSTLLIVGIAAIAALVGGPGLGGEIFQNGIRRIGSPGALDALLGGTLAIVVLALLFDLLYLAIGRLTIPRGIRE